MSAQQVEEQHDEVAARPVEPVAAPEPLAGVEVRRNAAVGAAIGVAAAAVAIGYLGRAAGSGSVLEWTVCVVMGVLAVVFLRSLFDARTPLLVIDDLGVRMRLARSWRGLPWDAVESVAVQPRRGLLHDGRVVVQLHHSERAVEGLDGRARRQAALNRRRYGATLAVPLGLTTRVVGADAEEIADRVTTLSEGRAAVVTLVTGRAALGERREDVEPDLEPDIEPDIEPAPSPELDVDLASSAQPPLVTGRAARDGQPQRRARWLRRSGRPDSRVGLDEGAAEDVEAQDVEAQDVEAQVHEAQGPADLDPGVASTGSTAYVDVPGDRSEDELEPPTAPVALRRIGEVTTAVTTAVTGAVSGAVSKAVAPVHDREGADSTVRAIARLGEPVAPLVIDDFRPEPAYDPVIGPELAAARTRVGLSVDELADRTRIRPHVIESIEVDDFAPCGGDFYARGHIRTLARVLGKDPVPLLDRFEDRYASGPVNARTVFEAELSTGRVASMRRTSGGPNWALLVGAVLALVLVWSLVRLLAGSGAEVLQDPPPMLNGSGGIGAGVEPHHPGSAAAGGAAAGRAAAAPVPTTLSAVGGGTDVVVRDAGGAVVFHGALAVGEVRRLRVRPPVTVMAGDGSVVSVSLAGRDLGPVGDAQARATRTYHRPPR